MSEVEKWVEQPRKKHCSDCDTWYERTPENFYRSRNSYDGLDHTCKTCKKERGKKYQARRVARQNAKQRAFHRLAKIYPEQFDRLLKEEFSKEGYDLKWGAHQELIVPEPRKYTRKKAG